MFVSKRAKEPADSFYEEEPIVWIASFNGFGDLFQSQSYTRLSRSDWRCDRVGKGPRCNLIPSPNHSRSHRQLNGIVSDPGISAANGSGRHRFADGYLLLSAKQRSRHGTSNVCFPDPGISSTKE